MVQNISNNIKGNSAAADGKQKKQPQRRKEKRPPKKITRDYLHNAGLFYLQRFSSSSGNFRKVMQRKIYKSCQAHPDQDESACNEILEDVINRFIESGLLNDELYARSTVSSMRRSGKSKRQIESKLMIKSMKQNQIKQAIETYEEESDNHNDELAAALIFARKKRLGQFSQSEVRDVKKELATFARAGFSYNTAQKALNTDLDDFAPF
ncbi:MAG: RecX family transcriptional regulator [Micavibrio sp.]|nr:RecX family transcriptional regulator [Micavibrio sp.]